MIVVCQNRLTINTVARQKLGSLDCHWKMTVYLRQQILEQKLCHLKRPSMAPQRVAAKVLN